MRPLSTIGVFGALAVSACGGGSDSTSLDSAPLDSAPAAELPTSSEAAVTATAGAEPAATEPSTTEPTVTDGGDGFVFAAPTGDYMITFPGSPTPTELSIPLGGDVLTGDAFIFEDGRRAAYFTSVFEYPAGILDPDPAVALESARDGAVETVGATVTTSEFIERDSIQGISFTFTAQNGGVGSAVAFVDDPRLYQAFAVGESDLAAAYQLFVDSFEFIDALSTEAGS